MSKEIQLCTFRVGKLTCGLELEHIQEIMNYQDLTPVPLAPPSVCGLLNLRGRVVTAVDMHRQLGIPGSGEIHAGTCNLVVRRGARILSLVVDDIGDVYSVDADSMEPAPSTVHATVRNTIRGVFQVEGSLLLALDIQEITDIHEVDSPNT